MRRIWLSVPGRTGKQITDLKLHLLVMAKRRQKAGFSKATES